jgi:hypothetical protein
MGIWAAVKYALNSTVGTSAFQPLDKLLFTPHGTQTFTKDGTFTVPAGVTKILVTAFGAGGGGNHSGGQGGARIIKKAYSVTPQTSIQITIGIGGTAGNDGGATVIGNLVTLEGGGSKKFKEHHNGALGGAYGAKAGTYSENGQDSPESYGGKGGYNRPSTGGDVYSGGGGGGAGFGRGGDGGNGDYGSKAGKDGGIGAGGGGGGQGASSGSGGNGIVIIEW